MADQTQSRNGGGMAAAADDIRRRAGAAGDEARQAAEQHAERVTGQIGERGATVAEAFRTTGRELRGKEDWLADAADLVGDNVERLARAASEKGPRGVRDDLETLARNRPALFMGVAIAAGICAGRLLRSAPSRTPAGDFDRNPATHPAASPYGHGPAAGSPTPASPTTGHGPASPTPSPAGSVKSTNPAGGL